MAQPQQRMKGFYLGLGAIALVGVGALLWARSSGGGTSLSLETVEPIALTGTGFEGYVLGRDSAPVTIVEYADFQCPACARFALLTGPDVKRRLVEPGRVRWVFRDFPLNIHPNAVPAHHAAACASDQGRFWEMHDMLFSRHSDWVQESRPERRFVEYARGLGLDMPVYEACMNEGRHLARIRALQQQGIEQGVTSTPTFIIGNQRVSDALLYDELVRLVDQAAAAPQ